MTRRIKFSIIQYFLDFPKAHPLLKGCSGLRTVLQWVLLSLLLTHALESILQIFRAGRHTPGVNQYQQVLRVRRRPRGRRRVSAAGGLARPGPALPLRPRHVSALSLSLYVLYTI